MKPKICILKTDGTNCDQETKFAFEKAGGQADIILLNHLKKNSSLLHEYHILVIAGGFSYGDDVASGVILATELLVHLKKEIQQFIAQKKLIIGICNGFQVLVRTGLLPTSTMEMQNVALIENDSGHFECRWVDMVVEKSPCVFTKSLEGQTISLQVAHAEGKCFMPAKVLSGCKEQQLIPLRYTSKTNPNGALDNIAGLCDQTGRIFGLMPHPERFVNTYQHPNWRREETKPIGLTIFENAVTYVKENK